WRAGSNSTGGSSATSSSSAAPWILAPTRRWRGTSAGRARGSRGPRTPSPDGFRRSLDSPLRPRSSPRRVRSRPAPTSRRGSAVRLRTAVPFGMRLGAGLALLYFFPRRVEVIARTARASTVRSGLVGLAGIVLAVPLWVVGFVLLAVSIIGIPLILLWAPAVPLAVGAAIVAGYLAVAHNLGRWISGEEPSPGSGTFGAGTPATHIGVGLLVLLGAFAVANVFEMGGAWFRVFEHV